MNTETDVVVVGAGLSGLLVAHRLERAGLDVIVLEARERVGGRTLTVEGVDLGASWVWDTERHVHRLLAELDIATFPHHREGLDLYESPQGLQRGRLPRSAVPERRVIGGPAALCTRLHARLATVRTRAPVHAIVRGTTGLEVRSSAGTHRARHVVAALPPALLATRIDLPDVDASLLDPLRATGVWMADVAKVVARYPRRAWREQGLSGRAASALGPMTEIHDLSGPDGDPAALFGFVHRAHATGDWEDRAAQQFDRLFGPPDTVVAKAWWEEPETAAVSGAGRELERMGAPALRRPLLGGRLHLCSTETSAVSPGHLEGAIERAEAVAAVLLTERRAGRPTS